MRRAQKVAQCSLCSSCHFVNMKKLVSYFFLEFHMQSLFLLLHHALTRPDFLFLARESAISPGIGLQLFLTRILGICSLQSKPDQFFSNRPLRIERNTTVPIITLQRNNRKPG